MFPPSTESATPAPLGSAINTPTHRRLISPRDLISGVGKLVELPHFVPRDVVNNLVKDANEFIAPLIVTTIVPKDESTGGADEQADQFVAKTASPQRMFANRKAKDNAQNGIHQRTDQHAGHDHDRRVFQEAKCSEH